MAIVGFDISLTGPAACILPLRWRPGDWKRARVEHLKFDSLKLDDARGRVERHLTIARWVCAVVERAGIDNDNTSCWIEGYAYNQNTNAMSRLIELGGVVREWLWVKRGIIPVIVASASARKVFFGNRKLPRSNVKTGVHLALYNEAHAPKKWTEDEADAFLVAQAGLSAAGGTVLTLE
jgi:hypothetical protein